MTRSRVVRKSLNPLLWQTWVFGWYKIRAYRYQLADRVNARSGWLARWIRWPLGVGSPDRWSEVHVFRVGGIGDSLMSTPALRLLKQIRPQIRIVFYTPYRGGLPGPALSRRGSAPRGLLLIPPRCGRSPSRAA